MTATEFKWWRERLSLTQEEAAAALGLSRRYIVYAESGERGVSATVALLCKALEIIPRKKWPRL